MAAIAASALIANAQTKSDIRQSSFLSTAEWLALANDAYRKLWAVVMAANPDFRINTQAFSITNTATPNAALPADYFATREVIKDFGLQSEEILSSAPFRVSRRQNKRSYRIDGQNVIVEPYQLSAGNYTHRYNPDVVQFVLTTDLMDVELSRFSEFIELHVAEKARIIDESPSDSLTLALWGNGKVAGVADQVMDWAVSRRTSDPLMVEDVRPRRRRGWPSRWPA